MTEISADELIAVLDEMAPAGVDDTAVPWRIGDEEDADWCLQRIGAGEAHIARFEKYVEAQKFKLDQWLKARTAAEREEIERFTGYLHEYMLERLQADPETKTISLPSGEISMRKQPAVWNRDEAQLLDWATEGHPEYVKIERSLMWDALKKAAVRQGGTAKLGEEFLPGVTVVDLPDKFSVKARG